MDKDNFLTGIDDIDIVENRYLVVNGGTGEVVRLGKPPELPFDEAQSRCEDEILLLKNGS